MGGALKIDTSTIRVLFVDDDPDIRDLVDICLSAEPDIQLHICENGADAMSAFATFKPDLVLLDVNLPDTAGPDIMQQIQQHKDQTSPIVFLTADTQQAETDRLVSSGAAGVIAKPFDAPKLASTLRSFL